MQNTGISKQDMIRCDSAEPDRIQSIKEAGFRAIQAKKNINSGIDAVKSYNLHITEDSVNLLREIQSYKWAEDRNGNTLDTPIKMNDHILDALRYSIFTDIQKQTISVITAKKHTSSFSGYDSGVTLSNRNKLFHNLNNF